MAFESLYFNFFTFYVSSMGLSWTMFFPSLQCHGMSDFRTMRVVRNSHTQTLLSLAIVHAVMIAAVTWVVVMSAPIYS